MIDLTKLDDALRYKERRETRGAEQPPRTMETYSKWADVPEHLKTKTGLNQAGLRRRPKQGAVAQIDTRWGSHGGVYDLYDVRECITQTPLTDEQKQQRAERLRQARIDTHCNVCDAYVAKADKQAQDGLCASCVQWKARRLERKRELRDKAISLLQGCLILDTETTGLSSTDAIIELAIINQSGNTVFCGLIHPEFPDGYIKDAWPDATNINGITPEMVTHAPRLSELQPQILERIGDLPVVIYNAEFDTAFLQRAGITLTNTFCLMTGFAKYRGEWSNYYHEYKWCSLDMACAVMGIDRTTRHKALADTQDTRRLLQAIATREPDVMPFEMYH